MAHGKRTKATLKRYRLKGVNKPKRTPGHKTKSHIVLAQTGHKTKLIRFGQQGAKTAGKPNPTREATRKKSEKSKAENIKH